MTIATAYQDRRPLALIATTPDDSHAWNLIGIALHLEERGFRIENLGPCTPETLLAETIRERKPDLVVISSVNGHGSLSIPKVLDTLMMYQVKRQAPIVAGGFLTTDPATSHEVSDDLLEAGIAAVFQGDTAWQDFDAFLNAQAV